MSDRRHGSALRAILLSVLPLLQPTSLAPEDAVLLAADAPRHVLSEGVIRLLATVERPGKPATESVLDVFVRRPDQTLCAFREGSFAGRRILVDGDRVWLLLPDTTHPVRVSPNQRLFGGASIADVARLSFAEEFTARLEEGEEDVGGVPCQIVTLTGRTRSAAYGKGTLWVGKVDRLPRRAVLALPSGKLAKDLRFLDFAEYDGKTVLRRLEIRHLVPSEHGMVTRLEFLGYEQRKLPEGLFDPERARGELP